MVIFIVIFVCVILFVLVFLWKKATEEWREHKEAELKKQQKEAKKIALITKLQKKSELEKQQQKIEQKEIELKEVKQTSVHYGNTSGKIKELEKIEPISKLQKETELKIKQQKYAEQKEAEQKKEEQKEAEQKEAKKIALIAKLQKETKLKIQQKKDIEQKEAEQKEAKKIELIAKSQKIIQPKIKKELPKWYTIHTYNGDEDKVKDAIKQMKTSLSFEDSIIDLKIIERTETNIKTNEESLENIYPGCVFIKAVMTVDILHRIINTNGVKNFMGYSAKNLEPIPFKESEKSNFLGINKDSNFDNQMKLLKDKGFKLISPNFLLNKNGECYSINKNIKSIKKETPGINYNTIYNYKYSGYSIYVDNKINCMHRLVAINFCDNPNNYKYVIRKDGDEYNYNSSNLEWVKTPFQKTTQKQNTKEKSNIKEDAWLKFIIDNFINGINIIGLSKILTDKAKDNNFKQNISGHELIIRKTIKLYSQSNKKLHFFTIQKDLRDTVYFERKNYDLFIQGK